VFEGFSPKVEKEPFMPLTEDLSGMPTSLSPDLITLWNRVVLGILSHAAATGTELNSVLAADPNFALGQAVRGLSCLLLGRAEMVSVAREAYQAACDAAPGTARETAFVAALGDWLEGNPTRAAARVQAVLHRNPCDALAMKLVQGIQFVMGRPGEMRRSIESIQGAWADHPARGYLMGCHAFALEETGDYAAAERIGRAGVEFAPDDAWGLHAVAHVYDMTGRARDGLAWLNGRQTSWAHCNNFRFHVWWHRALMHLDLQQYDAALALYDSDIRGERTDDYRDIANASSLLSRLELDGVNVGARWEELADLSERRAMDGCLAFADLHYLLALVGGGRDAAAARLVARMAKASVEQGEAKHIIANPGLHMAQGIAAFAAGEYSAAWLRLRQVRDVQQIGGSHAQRDIFARITIEAALRGGYLDAAERLLRDRQVQRENHEDGYTARRIALIDAARSEAG
jgi:tetratricopeptide (TPR) repeat protein